jgi:3-oxoacyl-[acyl-carrier protein] reductase
MMCNTAKVTEISLVKSLTQQLAQDHIPVVGLAPGSILVPGGAWHKRQQADPKGIAEFLRCELPFGASGRPK